jgi:hypothetical protein
MRRVRASKRQCWQYSFWNTISLLGYDAVDSSSWSPQPATGPYPEPVECSARTDLFRPKFCMHFLCCPCMLTGGISQIVGRSHILRRFVPIFGIFCTLYIISAGLLMHMKVRLTRTQCSAHEGATGNVCIKVCLYSSENSSIRMDKTWKLSLA